MGAGLAMQYSKAIPQSDRQECRSPALARYRRKLNILHSSTHAQNWWMGLRQRKFASQSVRGEELFLRRIVRRSMGHGARCVEPNSSLTIFLNRFEGLVDIGKTAPNFSSVVELTAFRKQMTDALQNVRMGGPSMGTSALRRLLLRATAVLISSPVVSCCRCEECRR